MALSARAQQYLFYALTDKVISQEVSDAVALQLAAGDAASTANGKGASLVGIEDPAGLITGTTVESALAELVKYDEVLLADPGTGVAIPVTRSATVPLTIGAGSETNTLAIPTFLGQSMLIVTDVQGAGTRAITAAAALNQAGNTVMTFGTAAGRSIQLAAIRVAGTLRWRIVANDGVTLS